MVLSQLVNDRLRNRYYPTLEVLERHGLVTHADDWVVTDKGRAAMIEARKGGW